MRPQSKPLTKLEGITNLLWILTEHMALVFACGLVFFVPWAVIGLPVVFVIHQRMMSEWMHEAAHFNLYPGKARNDFFATLVLGPFFFDPIARHRAGHMRHHQTSEYFSEQDPDSRMLIIETKGDFWAGLSRDLLGGTALRVLRWKPDVADKPSPPTPLGFTLWVGGFHFALAGLLAWKVGPIGLAFLPAYLLVFLTGYSALNRIRFMCQHAAVDPTTGLTATRGSHISRTMITSPLDRFIFNSDLMRFHHEHHRYPSIPYRQLESLALASDMRSDPNVQYRGSRWALVRQLYRGLPGASEQVWVPRS